MVASRPRQRLVTIGPKADRGDDAPLTDGYATLIIVGCVADADNPQIRSASTVVVIRAWREDGALRARILFDPDNEPAPRSVVVIGRPSLCDAVWSYLTEKLPVRTPLPDEG